ncbi:MAG: hypothetical protein AAFY00_04665, partial [Bacteroidota bacterium]
MMKPILYLCMLSMAASFGQVEFSVTTDGITPKSISSEIDSLDATQLYLKTMGWIEENSETLNLKIDHIEENSSIQMSFLKGNATNLEKRYYNANYKVKLSLKEGQYIFEPIEIRLKLNSKYDMGWKEFD